MTATAQKDPFNPPKTSNKYREVRFANNVQLYENDPRAQWSREYNTFGRRLEGGKLGPAPGDSLVLTDVGIEFTTFDRKGVKRTTLVPWFNITYAVLDDSP